YRYFGGGFGGGGGGRGGNIGQNPPSGAIIYYTLKTAVNPEKPEAKEGLQASASAEAAPTATQEAAAAKEPGTPQANAPTGAKTEAQKQESTREVSAAKSKEEHVTVEILDAGGKAIRTFPPKQPTVT